MVHESLSIAWKVTEAERRSLGFGVEVRCGALSSDVVRLVTHSDVASDDDCRANTPDSENEDGDRRAASKIKYVVENFSKGDH